MNRLVFSVDSARAAGLPQCHHSSSSSRRVHQPAADRKVVRQLPFNTLRLSPAAASQQIYRYFMALERIVKNSDAVDGETCANPASWLLRTGSRFRQLASRTGGVW